VVADGNGTVEQTNEYYPYGGPWGDVSTNQGFQPYKYTGKELDRIHGLDWYDYGARRYDPAFAQFTQMDPLCEQYPHLSPYAYCAGNPVNAIDPDGRHIRVRRKGKNYEVIESGKVDDDLNIYDVTHGWENRVTIGKALTQYSFRDDDGNPVIGSIINLNDQSGQEFLTDFFNNTPSILNYMFNATKGEKYDFKQQNAPNPTIVPENMYNNRGMAISINGNDYIASARDIGNYAAGYIAGHNGLSWTEARLGFDALETRQHHFLPSIEGKPSRYAQFKGYTSGLKNLSLTKALKIRIIEYKMLKMLLP
jgi:RHS repeat-associated protein